MADAIDELGMYLHLARASELRRRPLVRDRLLLLAGVVAERCALPLIAAYCRQKVLQHNPQHLLGRWPDFAAALADASFRDYLRQQQRRYPPEKAERLLESLGIEMVRERASYYSDLEYAAALLGTSPAELERLFGPTEDEGPW